jgi:succinate dehydrogenase/fumarate reductase cytochrome b subunit
LNSADDFADVVALFEHTWMRAIVVLLVWVLAHHTLAGVRHMLFDIHIGTSPPLRPDHLRPVQMRRSAWAVLIADVLVVLLTIGALA